MYPYGNHDQTMGSTFVVAFVEDTPWDSSEKNYWTTKRQIGTVLWNISLSQATSIRIKRFHLGWDDGCGE